MDNHIDKKFSVGDTVVANSRIFAGQRRGIVRESDDRNKHGIPCHYFIDDMVISMIETELNTCRMLLIERRRDG